MKSGRSSNTESPSDESRVALDATEWLVRLSDTDFDPDEPYPDPLERQNAFVLWLTLDPAHVRAFMEIIEVERRASRPDPQHLIRIDELLSAARRAVIPIANLLPDIQGGAQPLLERGTSSHKPVESHENPRSWALAIMASAAALAAIVVGFVLIPRPITASSVYYATSVGERQSITLEDGSTMILNAATRVAVTFDRHTREVRLISGEALFDVRHDADRPFRVVADDVFIEDLGTQFDLNRLANLTRITVIKGSVQLMCGCVGREGPSASESSPAPNVPAHPSAMVTLRAGDQVDVNAAIANATLVRRKLSADEITHSVAWRDGELWFNNDLLSTAVEEFNRHSAHRILIADPTIARYRVGGRCLISQAEECARVVENTAGVVVLPPDATSPTTIRLARETNK